MSTYAVSADAVVCQVFTELSAELFGYCESRDMV